jgi:hypothetical protein
LFCTGAKVFILFFKTIAHLVLLLINGTMTLII